MKRISVVFAALAIVCGVASCKKEISAPADTFSISMIADVQEVSTKATLETDNDEDFVAAWETTDTIKVTASGEASGVFTATWDGTAFASNAVPSTLNGKKVKLDAVYPYVADNSDIHPDDVNRTQTGSALNSFYDQMTGSLEEVTLSENASVRIPMTRTTTVMYFHLKSSNSDALTKAVLSYGDKTITTTYTDVNANNAQLWFNVVPGVYDGMSLTIYTATQKATISTSTSQTYTANTLHRIMLPLAAEKWKDLDWVKIDYSSINSGDKLAIVGTNSTNSYALSNDKGTSAAPTAVAVTISNNKMPKPQDNCIWTATKDGEVIKFANSQSSFLYVTNTNNGLRVGTGNANGFIIKDGYLYNDDHGRYLGVYNNADWRCYTSINANISEQTFSFFVSEGTSQSGNETPITPQKYSISVGEVTGGTITADKNSAAEGETVTLTVTADDGYEFATLSVVDSNSSAVTVDSDNKFVMPASSVTVSGTFTKVETGGDDDELSTATFTLSGMTSSNSQTLSSIDVDDDNNKDIKLSFSKAKGTTAPTYYSSGDAVRIYANNIISVSGVGKVVRKVEFTFSNGYNTSLTSATESGKFETKGLVCTWTGSSTLLEITSTSNYRLTKVVVKYTENTGTDDGTPTDYSSIFSSAKWSNTAGDQISWESKKDGGFSTTQGVQISTSNTGASAESVQSFSSVSKIVVTYSTNASKGLGAIKVKVGSGNEKTANVSAPSSNGTTERTVSFDFDPNESGKIVLTGTCSTNSIYIKKIVVTATAVYL